MSFRVHKSLGNSAFQFGVTRRREFKSIDDDPELSTGPGGEFIRHRPEIHYSADLRAIRSPEVPVSRTIASTPFWTSVVDGTRQGWIRVAMMAAGVFFILIGLSVLVSKGPQGFAWIILGLGLFVVPVFTIARQRSLVRKQEEAVRRERDERDARNRELLAGYTATLERLREDPNEEALAFVQRENEKLDLPYAIWADAAIGTVLHVGFSSLARLGHARAAEVKELMDRASDAAGLIAEDARAVKHAVYSTILWHFLADDRLGRVQLEIVRAIQGGFGIKEEDVPSDTSAEAQFERLRGIDHRNAPRCETQVPLGMNEYCMFTAEVRQKDGTTKPVFVTNKRLIVEGDKRLEAEVQKIDDVTVEADASRVIVRAAELKKPLELLADEPIYLASMISLATRLDHRPKSFT